MARDAQIEGSIGSIDQHGDADRRSLRFPDDGQGFLNPPALGHDILDHQHPFPRLYLEASTEDESAFLLLHKDESGSKLTGNFLTNHQTTHGRGNHRLDLQMANPVGERRTETLDDGHLLESERALEELTGMKSAPEYKVAVQQGPGLSEE
jgi:hypothetical protein